MEPKFTGVGDESAPQMRALELQSQSRALSSLRKRCLVVALCYGLALFVGSRILSVVWTPRFAVRWAVLAAAVLVYEIWFLWTNLDLNHRSRELAPRPTFGLGNWLTVLRGLWIGMLAGFLFSPRPPGVLAWAPAILYVLSAIGDILDGYFARIAGRVTLLGAGLDMELDIVELLVAVGLVVWYGTLPWGFLALGFAPYALVLGLWLLRRSGRTVRDLPAWVHAPFGLWLRKRQERPADERPRGDSRWPIAGLLRGYMAVMLWPIVSPPEATLAGLLFALPFATRFAYHWLALSGMLDLRAPRYVSLRRAAKALFFRWLPLPLRGAVLLVVLPTSLVTIQDNTGTAAHYAALGLPFPSLTAALFACIALLGSALIGLGIAGHFAALAMLVPIALTTMTAGLSASRGVALATVISILILGTGSFSLWRPEGKVFSRRSDEQHR